MPLEGAVVTYIRLVTGSSCTHTVLGVMYGPATVLDIATLDQPVPPPRTRACNLHAPLRLSPSLKTSPSSLAAVQNVTSSDVEVRV